MPDSYEERLQEGDKAATKGDLAKAAEWFEFASELGDVPGHILMLERARLMHELLAAHQHPAELQPIEDAYRALGERDNLVWLATLHSPATGRWHSAIQHRLQLGADRLAKGRHRNEANDVLMALERFNDRVQ